VESQHKQGGVERKTYLPYFCYLGRSPNRGNSEEEGLSWEKKTTLKGQARRIFEGGWRSSVTHPRNFDCPPTAEAICQADRSTWSPSLPVHPNGMQHRQQPCQEQIHWNDMKKGYYNITR
jgi:hypothetical protein